MTTTKRRGFGSQVDALLDGPAAPVEAVDAAPQAAPAAAASSSGAPHARAASGSTARRPRSSAASSAGANVDQVDDDGPRLRASERSTLAGGNVRRTVYIGADDWRSVLRLAMRRGCTASDVTRAALRDYLRRHGGGSSA